MISLYQLHGLLRFIAFGILFPIGALIAVFREYIGESWYKWHVGIQLTAVVLVFIALIVVHIPKKKARVDKKYYRLHKIIGPTIVMLIITQVFWAYVGRKIVSWTPWLYIHMALSASIIGLGWFNLYIGKQMVTSTEAPQKDAKNTTDSRDQKEKKD